MLFWLCREAALGTAGGDGVSAACASAGPGHSPPLARVRSPGTGALPCYTPGAPGVGALSGELLGLREVPAGPSRGLRRAFVLLALRWVVPALLPLPLLQRVAWTRAELLISMTRVNKCLVTVLFIYF